MGDNKIQVANKEAERIQEESIEFQVEKQSEILLLSLLLLLPDAKMLVVSMKFLLLYFGLPHFHLILSTFFSTYTTTCFSATNSGVCVAYNLHAQFAIDIKVATNFLIVALFQYKIVSLKLKSAPNNTKSSNANAPNQDQDLSS